MIRKIFYGLMALSMVACGKKSTTHKETTPNQSSQNTAQDKTSPKTAIPHQINIFLETSGSMKGYFAGQEFVALVTKLPTISEGITQNKNVKINLIADNIVPYTQSHFDFSNEVSSKGAAFCTGKSSEMSKLFKNVADNTSNDAISLFVSDCILSFGNQATNAVNVAALEAGIRSTFADIRQKGFAVSVYAFESTFKGSYFTMNNTEDRQSYKDGSQRRPFYVWAVGKKDLLAAFRKQIANDQAFQPLQSLHVGFDYKVINEYGVLAQMVQQRGDFKVEKYKKLYDIDGVEERPLAFYVGINADNLPPYALKNLLNEKKIKITGQGVGGKVLKIETDLMPYNPVPADIAAMKNYTHFIKVQIDKMIPEKATLQIQLPFEANEWYKACSTLDDTAPEKTKGKTFAFANLVNGVQEAYQEQKSFENFIDIKIDLEKE